MGGAQPSVNTYYLKGQKMMTDTGTVAIVMDFDARTVTTINKSTKTYTVKSFDAATAGAKPVNASIDVKETGQKKMVNGFNASELVLTMEVDAPQGMPGGGKMQMTMNMWLSSEVPGMDQLYGFYQRNAANFPWAAMGGAGNSSMAAQMAEVQKKIVSMHGVPVQQVMKVNPAGGGASGMPQGMPQMTGAQAAQMAQARQRLEAMAAQGGPAAAAAQQALARMPGGAPGASGASVGGGALFQVTMDSSDFSSAAVPDSVFAVPADYKQGN